MTKKEKSKNQMISLQIYGLLLFYLYIYLLFCDKRDIAHVFLLNHGREIKYKTKSSTNNFPEFFFDGIL